MVAIVAGGVVRRERDHHADGDAHEEGAHAVCPVVEFLAVDVVGDERVRDENEQD